MWLCVVKLMTAYLFVHIFILCVCVLFAEFINADHRFRGVCFFYICLCAAYILTAKALIESEYEIERARARSLAHGQPTPNIIFVLCIL